MPMPIVFNLGSINLDRTIRVSHFPQPGETIEGSIFEDSLGGKGTNISVALQRAGQSLVHIGALHRNDVVLKGFLDQFGIDKSYVEKSDQPSGQAYIFLDQNAENSIVVCGGANLAISQNHIEQALSTAVEGDWLVMQNETNGQKFAIDLARKKRMKIALVAAPFSSEQVMGFLDEIDLLALNETEAQELEKAFDTSVQNIRGPSLLVTKGSSGATLMTREQQYSVSGKTVTPRDTTGAGDTFFGYFLASLICGKDEQESLEIGNAAAALAVQEYGAANSIPELDDVLRSLER